MEVLRKYGVATTILFPLVDAGANDFEATPVTFAAGDTKIIKDEGAAANTTNDPAHEGNGIYSLALTATEMQAARVAVTIIDSATKAWEDQAVLIATYGDASAQHAFDLDSTKVDLNDSAISGDVLKTSAIEKIAGGILPKKNNAFSNIEFVMVSSTDRVSLLTGLTVTGERSIDGGAFTSVGGSIAEVGHGVYKFDALAADMNGTIITFRFSATGAEDTVFGLRTGG